VTLARIAKLTAPEPPYRRPIPVFTLRDLHSHLPVAAVDVTPHRDRIGEVASLYFHGVGFGDPEWLEWRLSEAGSRWGFLYAEEFDAWETAPGPADALLPPRPLGGVAHPERAERRG
jgi:hypothetical protein